MKYRILKKVYIITDHKDNRDIKDWIIKKYNSIKIITPLLNIYKLNNFIKIIN